MARPAVKTVAENDVGWGRHGGTSRCDWSLGSSVKVTSEPARMQTCNPGSYQLCFAPAACEICGVPLCVSLPSVRVSVRAARICVCVRIAAAPFQQGSGVLTPEVWPCRGSTKHGRNGSGVRERSNEALSIYPCCALLASSRLTKREAKASRKKAHASIASPQKSFQTCGRAAMRFGTTSRNVLYFGSFSC